MRLHREASRQCTICCFLISIFDPPTKYERNDENIEEQRIDSYLILSDLVVV